MSVECHSQCNNVNIAGSRPTSKAFGSATGDLLEPWRAFDEGDGSSQTRWAAPDGGLTHYIGIDLGQTYNLCSVYLEMGSLDYATSFKVQGSNDTTTAWTDLISITNNTQNVLTVDNLPTTGTYRYVRVLLLNRVYSWSYYNVYKMEVFNRVVNDPPLVNLTAPAAGASYIVGTAVELTATGTDVNGSISKIEFYDSTSKLGEDSSAPYSFSWTNATVGGHNIFAKATDNGGASTWTDPVHITITNPPASLHNWSLTGNNLANTNTGFVSIGGAPTTLPADTAIKLAVKGTIYARKLTVTESLWADFVFKPGYRLRPLHEVENFIDANHHLPGIPSAGYVERHGINVGDNQAVLLQKIEELTLYVIKMNKQLQQQQQEIKRLKKNQAK